MADNRVIVSPIKKKNIPKLLYSIILEKYGILKMCFENIFNRNTLVIVNLHIFTNTNLQTLLQKYFTECFSAFKIQFPKKKKKQKRGNDTKTALINSYFYLYILHEILYLFVA